MRPVLAYECGLQKRAVIGNLLSSIEPPDQAMTYPELKSIARHARKVGIQNVSPAAQEAVGYHKTIGNMVRDIRGAAGDSSFDSLLRQRNIDYIPSGGAFTGRGFKLTTIKSPTAFHELGHALDLAKGKSFGDRGFFGIGGKAGTMIPSEISATVHGIEALQRAGMPKGIQEHAHKQLAHGLDTYRTAARFNPEGRFIVFDLPEQAKASSRLLESLSEGFRAPKDRRMFLDEDKLSKLEKWYANKSPQGQWTTDTFLGTKEWPNYRTPVTRQQKRVAQSGSGSLYWKGPKTHPGRFTYGAQNIARHNKAKLLENLSKLTPVDQTTLREEVKRYLRETLREEVKRYLRETGDDLGREARRSAIHELKNVRTAYRKIYGLPKPSVLKQLRRLIRR